MRVLIVEDFIEARETAVEAIRIVLGRDVEIIAPDSYDGCREAMLEGADLLILDYTLDRFEGNREVGPTMFSKYINDKRTPTIMNTQEDPKKLLKIMGEIAHATRFYIPEDISKLDAYYLSISFGKGLKALGLSDSGEKVAI